MLSKKDRAALIKALNTALKLYVEGVTNKEHFAKIIAIELDLPHVEHFVAACVSEY